MKRDMDIIRKVLLAVEEQYVDVAIHDLKVDDADRKTLAYHCKILHEGGYLSDYKAQFAGNEIYSFGVGSLTWEGHEFLDKIRDDSVWTRTKSTIVEKGLPMALDVVKDVATALISRMTQAAIQNII